MTLSLPSPPSPKSLPSPRSAKPPKPDRPAPPGFAWWTASDYAGPRIYETDPAGRIVGWYRPIERIGYVLGPAL